MKKLTELPNYALPKDTFWIRLAHFLIDFIALLLLSSVCSIPITMFGFPTGIVGIIQIIIWFFLYVFFEYKWQKTPAKWITKTSVVNEFGQKPLLNNILKRTIIRCLPFDGLILFIQGITLHDLWSNTYVIPDKDLSKIAELQNQS